MRNICFLHAFGTSIAVIFSLYQLRIRQVLAQSHQAFQCCWFKDATKIDSARFENWKLINDVAIAISTDVN
jgi:hypothetical protein